SKMGNVDINTLTMEQYLALTRGNQAPVMVKPEIGNTINFKMKSPFMRELKEDTFSGNKNDDAHEHVARVLDIVRLFYIPGVSHDAIMLRVFSITLTGAAKRCIDRHEEAYENVHAIQVGCVLRGGTHINKECSLNKEVKGVEEVKYGEFGKSFPNNGRNRARYRVGPPGYYTRMENRPPFGKKKLSIEELINKHIEESTQRRTEIEE
ncbi:hypothetical protein Tco_0866577, partial [Tanacetum coccineum]